MPVTIDGTSGITTPTYNGADTSEYIVPVTAFKNRIINGAMGIWQRGTSGFTTSGNYSADRFVAQTGGTLTAVAQSTDVPSGFKFSLSVAGTNQPAIFQRIESANCTDLVGQSITIQFQAKQSVGAGTNTLAIALYHANTSDNFSGLTQIGSTQFFNGSSSWSTFSATFSSLPAGAANGLHVLIISVVTGSSTTLFTGVQLEKGSTATSFDYRPYGTELALCQRYFETSYSQGTALGTATLAGGQCCAGVTVNDIAMTTYYKVTKRTSPTIVLYSPSTGTVNNIRNFTLGADVTSALSEVGDTGFRVYKVSGIVSGNFYGYHYTASAEL